MLVDDLQVVLKVAEFQSIKQAADSLDIRVATASTAVKRVEKHYGIELFVRSTRQLRLSSAGEKYIPRIEQAVLTLNQIGQSAQDELNLVDGELRLAVPSDLGRNILLPWLDEFIEEHPKLSIKLNIGDRNTDFYRDPVDVALRYGVPKDSNMFGFKICDVPRILCAAPSYLNTITPPKHPNDLTQLNGLCYQIRDLVNNTWEFSKGDETFKVKVPSNRVVNDAEIVRRWCVAGYGVATKSILDMSADLLAGRVVHLMPDYAPSPKELWLICPSRQLITPAVRLLRDHITARCQQLICKLRDSGHFT